MEDGTEPTTRFGDWELLQWSESDTSPPSDGESHGFEVIDEWAAASVDGAEEEAGTEIPNWLNSDHFSIRFAKREVDVTRTLGSDAELRRVEHHTWSACSRELGEEMAPAGDESRCGDSGEDMEVEDTINGKLGDSSVDVTSETGFDAVPSEINRAAAAAAESSTPSVADSSGEGEGSSYVNEFDHRKSEAAQNEGPEMTSVTCRSENEFFGECSEPRKIEIAGTEDSELSIADPHGQSNQMHDLSERGHKTSGNPTSGKTPAIWWNLPLELLKFCAFKVRPVWSISIAAAMVGAAMLTCRLNKMRRASRLVPSTLRVNDKKTSQFFITVRLNNAYPMARHAPVIKASLRMGEITPWPAMTLW